MELSEEEKKAIEWLENAKFFSARLYAPIILNLLDQYPKEIEELKEKNKTLETLLQGNLYEMYLYYKELASRYQANSISKDKIREKIKNIEDIYKKEMKPYQTEFGLNVSFLSKKEKEELINKRNGLLTQKITLEELLEGNENE